MNSWSDTFRSIVGPELIAVIGAVLGWIRAPGDTLRQRIFNLGTGIGTAVFCVRYFVTEFKIQTVEGAVAFGFIFGLIAMNLISKLLVWVTALTWEDALDFILRMKGPKK